MYTKERIIRLMSQGDIWLQRDHPDGFIYVVWRDETKKTEHDRRDLIDQRMAKQIIALSPQVYQERWRQGWAETKETGAVRWCINCFE
jgi:hypothetical protein